MRKFVVAAVLLTVVAVTGAVTAVITQQQVQRSTVFQWTGHVAKPTRTGAAWQVTRTPTPTLDELEIHVTTLNPGESPHAPHQHQNEELLILKEGTLETVQNGVARRVETGGIIFQASNDLHGIRNVGQTPATYYVIAWKVPGAGK
jgi:mannose-6-phosphate isomerase-like protein (cupin superfamily)